MSGPEAGSARDLILARRPLAVVARVFMSLWPVVRLRFPAPRDNRRVTEQIRTSGMYGQPILQHTGQEPGQRHPPRRALALYSLLFMNEDGMAHEIDIGDLNAEQLAPRAPVWAAKHTIG